MSSNTLTAKVRLDVRQVETAIDKINKKINAINNATTGRNNKTKEEVLLYSKLSKTAEVYRKKELEIEQIRQRSRNVLTATDKAAQKLARTQYEQWWQTQLTIREWQKAHPILNRLFVPFSKINNFADRLGNKLRDTNTKVGKVATNLSRWKNIFAIAIKQNSKFNKTLTTTGNIASSVGTRLKQLAATYLGVMGTQSVLNTTDAITGAENRINYLNYQSLGSAGANEDGSYSPAVFDATQETMDKMYTSAQKVRMSYTDMMANVSKTMTLAGDAFQGNIDNAIRFQEIMAESYTLGGASAQEMSSSMYQLTQALGAGILAGDELRSVREGAPLAYQKIEEFAQGVYNTTDSLKDMASEGMITSEMVVAAIMNMGDEADKAFAQTNVLFSQAFTQIKNAATKAFDPVFDIFRNTLNKCINSGLVAKVEDLFFDLSKGVQIALEGLSRVITWISDNWATVQTVLISGLLAIGVLLVALAAKALFFAIVNNAAFIGVALAIFLVIFALYGFYKGIINLTEAIALVGIGIAALFVIIGLITGSTVLLIIGLVIGLMVVIFSCLEYILGGIYAAGAFIYNLVAGVVNSIVQFLWTCFAEPFLGIIEWILNACNGGFDSFGGAVANLIGQVISWFLSLGKVVTKIIDAIFGTDWTSGLESLQDKVLKWGKKEEAITISREAPEIIGRKSYSDSYDKGAKVGRNIHSKINRVGVGLQDKMEGAFDKLSVDSIGEKFGLNFDEKLKTDVPDISGAYTMPDDLSKIADDTSKISDSLDLRDDDLDYLRKIAEMEWRKEYTTASIKVDMSNYNTINDDRDLDGIVKYLSDTLNEEMASLAYGVHY